MFVSDRRWPQLGWPAATENARRASSVRTLCVGCGTGLDHSTGRLRGVLLRRRVLVPAARADERHQPRHRADARPPHQAAGRAAAVLRADQTLRHLRPLLRRQFQRHTQEVPQHGRPRLRLSLTRSPRGPPSMSAEARGRFLRGHAPLPSWRSTPPHRPPVQAKIFVERNWASGFMSKTAYLNV